MAGVGLVQMCSSTHVGDNLQYVEQMMVQAHEAGVALVVLPENFAFMGFQDDLIGCAEPYGQGPIQHKLSQLAKYFGLWIIAGTIPIKGSGVKSRASCLVYDDKGMVVARYDKIHLFDVQVSSNESHQESAKIERGDSVVVVDTPIGRVGLSVCYDVRFPELYQQLLFKGAQIVTAPAAFTAITGLAHWELLLRARAVENLSYVLGANQWGHHENGRHTFGHTLVVEPWGTVIAQKNDNTGLLVAEIDLDHVRQIRQRFPCVDHHVLK